MAQREGWTVLGNQLILALLACNPFRGRRAQAVRHAGQVIWPDVLFHIMASDRTVIYDHHRVTSGDPSLAWELLGRPV